MYCDDYGYGTEYSNTTLIEAKVACSNDTSCKMIYSNACSKDNWKKCKGELKASKYGSCTWIKGNFSAASGQGKEKLGGLFNKTKYRIIKMSAKLLSHFHLVIRNIYNRPVAKRN